MNYNIKEIRPMSENTREELDRYLADVSGVVRNTTIKNPHKLTDRLLKESYGDKASSVLAFVPCILESQQALKILESESESELQLFGFFKEGLYHTNMRELLNGGSSLEDALEYVDFTNYVAYTSQLANFIYAQIRTHSQIQFLQQSNRCVSVDYGYFKPDEVFAITENQWTTIVENQSPIALKQYMKDSGVIRAEIFNRGKDSLQIRPFAIGLNILNSNASKHFFNQRVKDLHTQLETRNFANALSKVIQTLSIKQ